MSYFIIYGIIRIRTEFKWKEKIIKDKEKTFEISVPLNLDCFAVGTKV